MPVETNVIEPPVQAGDIIFSHKNGPLSLAIRLLSGSNYSHACLVGPNNTVFTTGFGGKGRKTLGFLPASEFRQLSMAEYLANKQYIVRSYRGLTTGQRQKIISWCTAQLGQKYPFRKTLELFILTLFGRRIDSLKAQPEQQHCYELVAKAYTAAGITLTPRAKNLDASGYDINEILHSPRLQPTRNC